MELSNNETLERTTVLTERGWQDAWEDWREAETVRRGPKGDQFEYIFAPAEFNRQQHWTFRLRRHPLGAESVGIVYRQAEQAP